MINISVVIPTYNRENYIKPAIESVIAQNDQGHNYQIIEIIVVDDGSTDDTETVVSRISDERLIFYKMNNNAGAASARNEGVKLSKGEWIAFQDSDDIWHKDKLKKQVDYLLDHSQTDMISHPIRARFDDGSEIVTGVFQADDCVPYLAKKNYYDTPTLLLRKETFINVGGFSPEMKALEDWEFALRFSDKYKIGMVDEVLIESQMISGGVSSGAANYYESRCRMIAKNREILIRHNCFDDAVKSLLMHAGNNGVLDMVGKMLELSLKTFSNYFRGGTD